MRVGIVTDEISSDIREALSLGVNWGICDFEVRSTSSGRVPFISDEDVQTLFQSRADFNATITALSPGTFRTSIDDKASVERDLAEVFPATIKLAQKLNAPIIITSGFVRSVGQQESDFSQAVQVLKAAARLAEREGITLALQNEPGYWADSGRKTARLLAAVDSRFLQACWDPANAFGAENYPYPVGYEAMKRWIVNIHVKDATRDSGLACVPIGEGKVNWLGQLRALVRNGKITNVTVETHCLPLVEKSKQNVETLKRMLKTIEQEESKAIAAS
jgi:sugar phosphate isomerase/epimerase